MLFVIIGPSFCLTISNKLSFEKFNFECNCQGHNYNDVDCVIQYEISNHILQPYKFLCYLSQVWKYYRFVIITARVLFLIYYFCFKFTITCTFHFTSFIRWDFVISLYAFSIWMKGVKTCVRRQRAFWSCERKGSLSNVWSEPGSCTNEREQTIVSYQCHAWVQ